MLEFSNVPALRLHASDVLMNDGSHNISSHCTSNHCKSTNLIQLVI